MKSITVDGIEYIPASEAQAIQPNGNRAVCVIDRGWIFAGDVTEADGRIYLDRAVWVFRWESCGFVAAVEDPTGNSVDLRPMKNRVDFPEGAEVFRIPVADDWGL